MTVDSFDSSSLPEALGPILESFLERLRCGERPSIKEYADRYPDHAAEILNLFPPLVELEQAGLAGDCAVRGYRGSRPFLPSNVRWRCGFSLCGR